MIDVQMIAKQEPVIVDCPFCMHSYQLKDAVTHPAPSVNAQILADLLDVKRKLEWFVDNYPQDVATSRYDFLASINAAIAAAGGKV